MMNEDYLFFPGLATPPSSPVLKEGTVSLTLGDATLTRTVRMALMRWQMMESK